MKSLSKRKPFREAGDRRRTKKMSGGKLGLMKNAFHAPCHLPRMSMCLALWASVSVCCVLAANS